MNTLKKNLKIIIIIFLVLLNLLMIYFYTNLVYYGCHFGMSWAFLCLTLLELIFLVTISVFNIVLFFVLKKKKVLLVLNVMINLLIMISVYLFCVKVLN